MIGKVRMIPRFGDSVIDDVTRLFLFYFPAFHPRLFTFSFVIIITPPALPFFTSSSTVLLLISTLQISLFLARVGNDV